MTRSASRFRSATDTAPPPQIPERCLQLLALWRSALALSWRERSALGPELEGLDRQLELLRERRLRVAVFGRVGVGKSSLLNALLGEPRFPTDVAHGCTRRQHCETWQEPVPGLGVVDLVDTPGIDEVAAASRQRLAARVALGADLVLFVLDADLSHPEAEALEQLIGLGKPLLMVLNRIDCWPVEERASLLASIRRRLPPAARHLELIGVAAAPRQAVLLADGRVRSQPAAAEIERLKDRLSSLLREQGLLMLALNALQAGDRFSQHLHQWRLRQHRHQAQSLIGRFAALKATGVAASPLVLLDLAGALACDTALVLQLCQVYGLTVTGPQARRLLGRVSGHTALLGGTQLGIQLLLGTLRQLLVLAAPFTGGLSLAPAAPVAVAQAALAVHTTRLTGRLAAAELLKGAQRGGGRPGALLQRLARQDPRVRQWLEHRQPEPGGVPLQALLP